MKKMNEIENTLRSLLRSNIVAFTYRKVNGEIRHAIGTRNLTLASAYTNTRIPTPTGDMQPNSYYDVQSNGWRSWKTGYVISIDGQAEMPKRTAEIPVEMTAREIPISKPTTGGVSGGKPTGGVSGGKVGTPTFTDKGVELEMGIGVEDFAKMVAHYVVEEFVARLTR